MRKLCLTDAFSLARIIKAADLKNEIVAFARSVKANGKTDVESVGFEFILTVISAAADEHVENEFYKLYASLKGTDTETVKALGLEDIKADIAELIEENDLKNFFHSVSSSISKQ